MVDENIINKVKADKKQIIERLDKQIEERKALSNKLERLKALLKKTTKFKNYQPVALSSEYILTLVLKFFANITLIYTALSFIPKVKNIIVPKYTKNIEKIEISNINLSLAVIKQPQSSKAIVENYNQRYFNPLYSNINIT